MAQTRMEIVQTSPASANPGPSAPDTDAAAQRTASVHGQDQVTVRQLLAEPMLQGRICGGVDGLDNPVTWCLPLSEVTSGSGVHRVSESDLSGVAVHMDAGQLANYDRARTVMAELTRRGAGALLVWPGRGHAPTELAAASRAADDAALPLVTVGPDVDYRQAGHLVASKVLAQSAHVLEYSMRVHRALGEVFAHGSGLAALTKTMSHLAQTPVVVTGSDGEVLAFGDVTNRGLPLESLHRFPRLVRPAQPLARLHPSHGDVRTFELNGAVMYATTTPITVAGETYGTVILIEPSWPTEEHDLAQRAVIAEQGSTLVGSELLRQRSIHAAEERARGDFVDTLLHGRFNDQHEIAARAQYYHFNPVGRFAVFVVTSHTLASGPRPSKTTAGTTSGALAKSVESSLADDYLTLATVIGSMLVIVRELPDSHDQHDALTERGLRQRFAEQVRRVTRGTLREDVLVAHGRAGTGAAGVTLSYREARTAASLARRTGGPSTCGYDDLRVFAAVQEISTSAAGRAFAAEILEPLRRADGQTGNLEHIVLAYIKESGNLNAAARELHLHRNTMLYKLDRASRAMQMDVRSAETQFMIWLAHHIDSMAGVQAALDSELTPPS